MRIKIDTEELIQQDIISSSTADSIHQFYKNKPSNSSTRILVLFGSLGALLVGLGIILIIGHNWDELTRNTKILLSYLPLIIGQACCLFTLIKKPNSPAWREASSIFLTLAVGASISLISQIYHIDGSWKEFIFGWSLLILPIIYLMRSSGSFFLYIIGITSYAFTKVSYYHWEVSYNYWIMLAAIIPFYIMEIKKDPTKNAIGFYNWMILISSTSTLSLLFYNLEEMVILGYLLLSLIFIAIGKMDIFRNIGTFKNAFLPMGIFGIVAILFTLSINDVNSDLCRHNNDLIIQNNLETLSCVVLSLIGLAISLLTIKDKKTQLGLSIAIPGSWILFILAISSPDAYILNNIILFAGAVALIYYSTQTEKISLLNFGMIIISGLIFIYFINSDLGFLFKGIVFILIGIAFFAANFIFTKNIKKNEN